MGGVIETPKKDKDLIQSRLKLAGEMYKEWKSKRKKKRTNNSKRSSKVMFMNMIHNKE